MVLDDLRSHVVRAPDAIAVADGGLRLTYRELARHASDLAARLARRGVGPDDVVAVYADRSAEFVVAKLAVLLAGAAYLPLDPAHPAARTSELLGLSGAVAVVSTGPLVSGGAPLGDDPEVVDLAQVPAETPASWARPDGAALAYVIYTSGSTGRPKGVMISHAGLANLARWHRRRFPPLPGDRTTLLCSPGFDGAVLDTWPTLTAGGTLVVVPAEVRTSPSALVAWLADEQITRTFLPTPLAEAVLDEVWPADTVLRQLHTGGAAMQRGVPAGLPFTVVNLYGPAEGTVAVTAATVRPGDPVPPAIGVPIDGVRCYVLDGLDPVPDGEPGEMCLAGVCVARGYLGNPAISARSFVPDIGAPGQRMYRTGDKVRRRADGTFEYIGRFDDQVKIRGFRIEPGEVSAVLRQHPAVRGAVVVAERSGHADARLIGYVASGAAPADLLEFAEARLPSYMVPTAIVVLPELPLTPNGKVDRAALPVPDRAAAGLATEAAPHRTPTEGALAAIMAGLLGIGEVGAGDDFFALGGTSLLVGRLATRIEAALNATVSLSELLDARTVTAIAAIVDRRAAAAAGAAAAGDATIDATIGATVAAAGGAAVGAAAGDAGRSVARADREPGSATVPPAPPPLVPARRDRPIPLTLPQERVWFFEQLSPGNLAYNFQITVSLRGRVEVDALRAALDEIIGRHEILRTAFVSADGVGQQRPVATVGTPFRVLDVPVEHTESVIASELCKPFDLTRPPLARYLLLRHGEDRSTFVLVEHHLVHDGWSFAVFLSELRVLYQAYAAGQRSPLPELAVQYADVAFWQRDWMRGEVLRAHIDHWTARLAGAPHTLDLPADRPRPTVMTFRGAALRIPVPAELSRALRAFSREHRVSLFSTMYTGFAALLHRYTGQQDMLVGTGAANRGRPEIEPLLGMFVNTLVLRTTVSGGMVYTDLLDQVQRTVVDALAWSETPVDAVIDAIGTARDPARTPLFQVMFSFHDSAVPDLEFGGLTGSITERANGSAKTDLNVIVIPRATQRVGREPRPEDDDLTLVWEYSTDLFDEATMSRMVAHYLNLLTDAMARPAASIDGLRLLTDAESRLLDSWSRGSAVIDADVRPAYPADATIPALFTAQVRRDPDATALVFGRTSMTYAELDRRANVLARLLRRRGVGVDSPVAVAIQRGPDLVIALLAVLKAGGSYLPIDIGSPAPRVTAMIAAARARVVLVTTAAAAAMTQVAGVDVVRVGAGPAPAADEADEYAAPPDTSHPSSLAYISFTSGSTGVPKGVAVPHRAVVRLISDPTFAPLGPGQRLLHLAPVAFDASTLEIWGALLTGATVVIAPPGPLGLPDIASLLRTADVTVAWLTAGLFHQVAETDIDAIARVPVLLSGGDVLNPDTVRAVLTARRGQPLVNGYGPTENTTFTACHVMTDPGQVGPTVPIGRPIQQTTVHVLDQRARPVPIGVTGELYTGGDGLARGYVGDASATARAFVPDPFGHGTRLYRTGDLVRWRADGTLEFVGRLDDQIKIRGFRAEPGEVAAVLRGHPSVREAVVVVAGEGAQRHLIGYVTPADGVDPGTLRPRPLRDFLASRLPDYLVPTGFKAVDRLPLNANGKVDRAALPAPERETAAPATPPKGATEQQLADVWRLLLPADGPRAGDIGREDSFFAIGGNSLLAARLMFRIREVFGVEVRMAAFYEAPTVAACAATIEAARPADPIAVGTARSGAARSTIGRRDRSAYRVPERRQMPDRPSALAPHLVRLTGDWALWRTVCLRSAGFPVEMLSALAATGLAEAADAVIAAAAGAADAAGAAVVGADGTPDAVIAADTAGRLPAAGGQAAADPVARDRAGAAYAAEFAAALRRQSKALYELAGQPALREAVAWQNRHALATGIDVLAGRGPEPTRRTSHHRQHEALVASYLQRYCAKNDTIGFFGPVGWSQIDDESGVRTTHAAPGHPLAVRTTYLEGWAVNAIMADHVTALRPWLVPRRMPFVGLDGTLLRRPLAPPVPLTPAEAAILRASDGIRDARAVAAVVLADASTGLSDVADVFAVMERLAGDHRLAWRVEVAPQDIRPERAMRTLLSRVTDDGVREPAEKALDELTAARDELAAAAGDAEAVTAAMAGLEATFTRLSGLPPTRRAGQLYAGRTVAFEECLRGGSVRLGADILDGVREALALVLDSARWYITACAATYARHFEELYRQRAAASGTDVVPFVDVWLMVHDALFSESLWLIEPVVSELRRRWSAILDLPAGGGRRIQLRSADLRERVTSQFPAQRLPWPMAVHHSPDLMIAGTESATEGGFTWVLGEVHPSCITSRYATWLEIHDAPDAVRAAIRYDLRSAAVWVAETAEVGGASTRLSNLLASPGDLRFLFAHDSCGYDPATTLVVGECDLVSSATGLRVRRRDGSLERGLGEVLGDLVSTVVANRFDLVPPGEHAPRITIDNLVVSRERWTLAATEPGFADIADESTRYLRARAWAASHGLPRHVFLRFTGERKPIYADLTSLASIDLISRGLRRSRRNAGADATVTVVEMLPTPDQAWLTDAQGQRYTAELRVVAVDQKASYQKQEG